MDLGIKGKRGLVCAASRGLGRGCAEALAEADNDARMLPEMQVVHIGGVEVRRREEVLDTLRDALTSGLGRLPSVRDIRCERRRAEEFWRRGDDGAATRRLVERRLLLLPVGRQQAAERAPLLPVVDRSFDCGDTRGEASVLGIDQLLLLRLAPKMILIVLIGRVVDIILLLVIVVVYYRWRGREALRRACRRLTMLSRYDQPQTD